MSKDFFDMSSKQSMVMGLLGGVAIISLIGFFVVLGGGVSVGGGKVAGNNTGNTAPTPTPTPTPTPDPTGGGNVAALSPVTKDDHVRGNPNAKITMIEFSDFECPFCGRHLPTLNQVLTQYGDDVRLVYRHFPLTSIHPNAQKAAEASECAGEQGKFWEMHDLLFANQTALTIPSLKSYAGQLELNQSQFDSCLDTSKYASKIAAQSAEGQAAGVTGTPGTFVNGELVRGAYPLATFTQIIDAQL